MRSEVSKWIKLTNLTLIKNSSLKQTIRRITPLPLLLACVATVTVTAQPAPAQTAPVTGTWKVVASPNGGKQAAGNILLATAALSSTDAWAVGAEPNQSQFLTATLAEHWDGTQWSIIPTPLISTPTAQLNSIAVINTSDIWAAGYSDNPNCLCGKTVVEHWTGSSWTRLTTPNPGVADYLTGIAAISSTDVWAVGYEWISNFTELPLLLHYNGTAWKTFNTSQLQFGQVSGIFARATNDVWAVGWTGQLPNVSALALHWNGTTLTRVAFPTEAGGSIVLKSASGVATNDVWAVGNYEFSGINGNLELSARSYHWDGSKWTPVTVGLSGYSFLDSVSALATDDVWAVGEGIVFPQPNELQVTFHWDGTKWSNVPNPEQGVLNAISALSTNEAWAVGYGFTTPGTYTLHFTVP
jgi:hypothetical protein